MQAALIKKLKGPVIERLPGLFLCGARMWHPMRRAYVVPDAARACDTQCDARMWTRLVPPPTQRQGTFLFR